MFRFGLEFILPVFIGGMFIWAMVGDDIKWWLEDRRKKKAEYVYVPDDKRIVLIGDLLGTPGWDSSELYVLTHPAGIKLLIDENDGTVKQVQIDGINIYPPTKAIRWLDTRVTVKFKSRKEIELEELTARINNHLEKEFPDAVADTSR